MGTESLLRLGDVVMINLPPGDYKIPGGMYKCNHQMSSVSKICRARDLLARDSGLRVIGYELDGIVSPKGVPYTFDREDLIPIKEL